jgi:hypothetical protein
MSTAGRISRRKDESGNTESREKRVRETAAESRSRKRQKQQEGVAGTLPLELLDKILGYMVASHSGRSVIKLSMVNRYFRQGIADNLKVWHQLYLQWRGPIRSPFTDFKTPRGVLRLRPTVPTSIPNFRVKAPPTT